MLNARAYEQRIDHPHHHTADEQRQRHDREDSPDFCRSSFVKRKAGIAVTTNAISVRLKRMSEIVLVAAARLAEKSAGISEIRRRK